MAPNTVSDNGQQNPRREGDLGIGKGVSLLGGLSVMGIVSSLLLFLLFVFSLGGCVRDTNRPIDRYVATIFLWCQIES